MTLSKNNDLTIDTENVPNSFGKLFWHFIKPVWKTYTVFVLLTLVTFIGYSVFAPMFSKSVIGKIEMFQGDKTELFKYVFPTVLMFACLDAFLVLLNIIASNLNMRYIVPIREHIISELTRYVHKNSLKYISDNSSGKLYQKISDASNLLSVISDFLWIVVSFVVMITTNAFIIIKINGLLSFIFLTWILLHVIWGLLKINKIRTCEEAYSKANSESAGKIIDTFVNFLNIKIFAGNKSTDRDIDHHTYEKIKLKREIIYSHRKMWIPQDLVGIAIFCLTISISLRLYQQGRINLSDIAYFFTAFSMINHNLFRLTESLTTLISKFISVNVGIKYILVPIDIKDIPQSQILHVSKGYIEFKNVYFKYKDKFVINSFNLKIKSGEKIGIVGASGAGKTTLINLLMRFYDINDGEITIDGQNIRNVTQNSLRSNISFVAQDVSMFNRTVYENISYSLPEAKYDDVIKYSKQAKAHEFIKSLPEGYNTIVGEHGVKLSGGQRQRISIARALLKNSKIIILDEATSALDSQTETFIQNKLFVLLKNKTTIVIAHRLSTLKNMDRIVVMKDGKIVEEGTHTYLLRKKGVYAGLWNLQSNGFISE